MVITYVIQKYIIHFVGMEEREFVGRIQVLIGRKAEEPGFEMNRANTN